MKRAICALSLFTIVSTFAADWSQWRGPAFNGSSSEKSLPTQWTKENVTWQVELPGPSAGTPVILGEKVFVTSIDNQAKTLHALCIDRKSGKIVWNNKAGDGVNRGEIGRAHV